MSVRTLAASGVALAVTACTLLVDTGGLADGTTMATPDDASSFDAAEASAPVEAAAPPDPCVAPSVELCERFDTPAAVSAYPADIDSSTSITSDATSFFSAPRSARFEIRPDTANTSPDATLALQTPGLLARFAFEGWVHIEYGEPQGKARLLFLTNGGPNFLLDQSGEIKDGSGTVLASMRPVEMGRWVRVSVELSTDAVPPTAAVSIGDDKATVPLSSSWSAGRILVRIGVSEANSPTRGWLVRWDDVVVRRL